MANPIKAVSGATEYMAPPTKLHITDEEYVNVYSVPESVQLGHEGFQVRARARRVRHLNRGVVLGHQVVILRLEGCQHCGSGLEVILPQAGGSEEGALTSTLTADGLCRLGYGEEEQPIGNRVGDKLRMLRAVNQIRRINGHVR